MKQIAWAAMMAAAILCPGTAKTMINYKSI